VAEDIKALSDELARDPNSLVFLRLGEALRVQGQLDAARQVAHAGLERHPGVIDGRDLYARILVDAGELGPAQQLWEDALRMDARHQGSLKGLGFLYYNQGDLDQALEYLERAIAVDPTNQSVVQALRFLQDVAAKLEATLEEEDVTPPDVFEGMEARDRGILLVDGQGRPLAGGVTTTDGADKTDEVAAYLAGVSQEAERTSRMLNLGEWQSLVVEGQSGNVHLSQAGGEALVFLARGREIPTGRLALMAERALGAARAWLKGQGL